MQYTKCLIRTEQEAKEFLEGMVDTEMPTQLPCIGIALEFDPDPRPTFRVGFFIYESDFADDGTPLS